LSKKSKEACGCGPYSFQYAYIAGNH